MKRKENQEGLQAYNICIRCSEDYSHNLGIEVCKKCGGEVELIICRPSELSKLKEPAIGRMVPF